MYYHRMYIKSRVFRKLSCVSIFSKLIMQSPKTVRGVVMEETDSCWLQSQIVCFDSFIWS